MRTLQEQHKHVAGLPDNNQLPASIALSESASVKQRTVTG